MWTNEGSADSSYFWMIKRLEADEHRAVRGAADERLHLGDLRFHSIFKNNLFPTMLLDVKGFATRWFFRGLLWALRGIAVYLSRPLWAYE